MNAESNLPLELRQMGLRLGTAGSWARCRNQPDGTVGQNSIDVEKNNLDAAGTILRGQCHALILPATGRQEIRENRAMDRDQPPAESQTPPALEPEDYYLDGPNLVFTEAYHLKRGTCCGSGCRHCPYGGVDSGENPAEEIKAR